MNQDPVASPPFKPPVVDSLAVRVVVDSAYERFLPEMTHEFAKIENISLVPGRQMTTFACEWGLSLHLESRAGGESGQYIVDFGYTPEIINRNFDLLDIDSRKINGLILSHAHRDHFGGMAGFVTQHRNRMPADLALYVGAEDVFRERWLGKPENPVSWGAVDKITLTAQKVAPVCCDRPQTLAGGFTTGFIGRNSFETVTGGSMVVDYDHFTEDERKGKLVKDTHPGEHATCYIVKGRGLVVITSCGHVGLINTIKTAMHVSGVDKLHAAIGGFHLGTAPLDYIDKTIDELESLKPDVVIPMHCSGANFIERMRTRMPKQLVTSNVGARFTFGL
ncbi:MAG: MBL fold metallo-hydrolase [Hyphomicrobiaceae bacterium]